MVGRAAPRSALGVMPLWNIFQKSENGYDNEAVADDSIRDYNYYNSMGPRRHNLGLALKCKRGVFIGKSLIL